MKKRVPLAGLLFGFALAAANLEDASLEVAKRLSTKLIGRTVAILDLQDQQPNVRELGRIFADQYLRVDLSGLGVKTVNRAEIEQLLRELKPSQSALAEAVAGGQNLNL